MKNIKLIFVLTVIILSLAGINCDCGEESKDSEESDVKAWFKNLGCKIQKGAGELQEQAKPWAEKIGSSAKEFGHNVANKYGEIKHKLTEDGPAASTTPFAVHNEPTEKILLAPLNHDPSAPLPATDNIPSVTPIAVDDRSLFQLNECPFNQIMDHRGNCRPKM